MEKDNMDLNETCSSSLANKLTTANHNNNNNSNSNSNSNSNYSKSISFTSVELMTKDKTRRRQSPTLFAIPTKRVQMSSLVLFLLFILMNLHVVIFSLLVVSAQEATPANYQLASQSSKLASDFQQTTDSKPPIARLISPWRQAAGANYREEEFIMQSSSSQPDEQQQQQDNEQSTTQATPIEDEESTTSQAADTNQQPVTTTSTTTTLYNQHQDEGQIPINATRRQYVTHDQLLKDNMDAASDEASASLGAKQVAPLTSRTGMSRLASSFGLSDLFSRYAPRPKPHPDQSQQQVTSTLSATQLATTPNTIPTSNQQQQQQQQQQSSSSSSSPNSCPGVCLDLITASIRCRNAIAAPCPSFFQKCCELDDVSFNGTPVETSAPITGGDSDSHTMSPADNMPQTGDQLSLGEQKIAPTNQQTQATSNNIAQANNSNSPHQPPATNNNQSNTSDGGDGGSRPQPKPQPQPQPQSAAEVVSAEEQHHHHIADVSPSSHQSSVYFLSSGGDSNEDDSTNQQQQHDQHLEQQQLQPNGSQQQQQLLTPTNLAQSIEQQQQQRLSSTSDTKFKISASQSFDLPLSSTTESPPNTNKHQNRLVMLQTANGTTYLLANSNNQQQQQQQQQQPLPSARPRPLYSNWTDYMLMLQTRPQMLAAGGSASSTSPLVVYHSNIDPVRKSPPPLPAATTTTPTTGNINSMSPANGAGGQTRQPQQQQQQQQIKIDNSQLDLSEKSASTDPDSKVIKDQHSAAPITTNKQRVNSISSPTTTTTTTTSTTAQPTSTTSTTTTPPPTTTTNKPTTTTTEEQQDTTTNDSSDQSGAPIGGGIASVLTSLFDAFMSSSLQATSNTGENSTVGEDSASQSAPSGDDESRSPQLAPDEQVGAPATVAPLAADQNDRRLGLDMSFRQRQQQQQQNELAPNGTRLFQTGDDNLVGTYPSAAPYPSLDWSINTDDQLSASGSGGEGGGGETTADNQASGSRCNGYCALDQFVGLCDSWHVAAECGPNKKCCITGSAGPNNNNQQAPSSRPAACQGACLPIYHSSLCTKPNELLVDSPSCLPNQVCCNQPAPTDDNNINNNNNNDNNYNDEDKRQQQSSGDTNNQESSSSSSSSQPSSLSSVASSLITALLPPPPPPIVANGQLQQQQHIHQPSANSNQQQHFEQQQQYQQAHHGKTTIPQSLMTTPSFASTAGTTLSPPQTTSSGGGLMNQLFQMFRSNTGLNKQKPRNQQQQPPMFINNQMTIPTQANIGAYQLYQQPQQQQQQQQQVYFAQSPNQQHLYDIQPAFSGVAGAGGQLGNQMMMATSASAPRPQAIQPMANQVSFPLAQGSVGQPGGGGGGAIMSPTSNHNNANQLLQRPSLHHQQQSLAYNPQQQHNHLNHHSLYHPGQANGGGFPHLINTDASQTYDAMQQQHQQQQRDKHKLNQLPPSEQQQQQQQIANNKQQFNNNRQQQQNYAMASQHQVFPIVDRKQMPAVSNIVVQQQPQVGHQLAPISYNQQQQHQQVNFINNQAQHRVVGQKTRPTAVIGTNNQQQQHLMSNQHQQHPATAGSFRPILGGQQQQTMTKWSPAGQQQPQQPPQSNSRPVANYNQVAPIRPIVPIVGGGGSPQTAGANNNAKQAPWVSTGSHDPDPNPTPNLNQQQQHLQRQKPLPPIVADRPRQQQQTTTAFRYPEAQQQQSDTSVVSAIPRHQQSSATSTSATPIQLSGLSSSLASSSSNLNVLISNGAAEPADKLLASGGGGTNKQPPLSSSIGADYEESIAGATLPLRPPPLVGGQQQVSNSNNNNNENDDSGDNLSATLATGATDEMLQQAPAVGQPMSASCPISGGAQCMTAPMLGYNCPAPDHRVDEQASCPVAGEICCLRNNIYSQAPEAHGQQQHRKSQATQTTTAATNWTRTGPASDELPPSSVNSDELPATGAPAAGAGTGTEQNTIDPIGSTDSIDSNEQPQVVVVVGQGEQAPAQPAQAKVYSTGCGLPGPARRQASRQGRVMGGSDSEPGYWCWQAALMNGKHEYLCGGALIGSKWVLTAAHCVTQHLRSESQLFVRLGQWNLNSSSPAERQSARSLPVKTSYVHHNHNGITLDNDIALLRLDDSLDLGSEPSICTICLPDRGATGSSAAAAQARPHGAPAATPLEPGKRCTVTGYGYESEAGPAALLVRQAELPIVSESECQNKTGAVLGKPFSLPASSFCAGGELGQDACHGDGGSPLACRQPDGYYELTGIVSWGYKCGHKDLPGLYARVSNFVGWINQIVSVNN